MIMSAHKYNINYIQTGVTLLVNFLEILQYSHHFRNKTRLFIIFTRLYRLFQIALYCTMRIDIHHALFEPLIGLSPVNNLNK